MTGIPVPLPNIVRQYTNCAGHTASFSAVDETFDHERVVVTRGPRSGLPVIVAVHSTALGQSLGGCRLWHYADWRDGLADALRLSEGMTYKCALAGLAHGGGKTVVVLPRGHVPREAKRRAVMHDVGDVVDSLGGSYATGPDAGTGPADMVTIHDRTAHVFCRPEEYGGSGDSSPHTAAGVLSALRAVCQQLFGTPELAGRRIAVVGLGHVGSHVARLLAAAGAEQLVADTDPAKRALADDLGATWVSPDAALTAAVDVLVPAALGGVVTHDLVPRLACAAIVGPANNQLADDAVAGELARRGILWAPDYVVGAGGVRYAILRELHKRSHEEAAAEVRAVGVALTEILDAAHRDGITPHDAAMRLARQRVAAGRPAPQ
jgi:glutamate dehydrogenase/leucine dehydrogenase